MKFNTLLFLIGCLFFSQFAIADNDHCRDIGNKYYSEFAVRYDKSYGDEAKEAMKLVLDRIRIKRAGWLDFEKIKNEINNVKVCVNLSTKPIYGSGVRTGSVYLTEEKTIIFNLVRYKAVDNQTQGADMGLALNMLHEFLGALGYPDENYEITSFVYLNVQADYFGDEVVSSVQESFVSAIKDTQMRKLNIRSELTARGGASGVGGGGDSVLIPLKSFSLVLLLMNKDYFELIFKRKLDFKKISRYLIEQQLEPVDGRTKYLIQKETFSTGIYTIYHDKKLMLGVDTVHWKKLLDIEDDGMDIRQEFVLGLIMQSILQYEAGI